MGWVPDSFELKNIIGFIHQHNLVTERVCLCLFVRCFLNFRLKF